MKKILLIFLFIFGISFNNVNAQKYQLTAQDSTSFFVKHFYWNMTSDAKKIISGSKTVEEYMEVTFWFSFVFGFVAVCVSCCIALSESGINRNNISKFYIVLNRLFIIVFHFIFWFFLFFIGMFLANLGSGWFIVAGIIFFISSIFLMISLNSKFLIPFSQTICIFWNIKKEYTNRYNFIKSQEILNHL